MPNVKVSELPVVTSVTDATAKLVVLESGALSAITPANLADDPTFAGLMLPSRHYTAEQYGAVADEYYADGVANATTTFTSATANFVSGDVGKTIVILKGGFSQYQDHHTTIASVTNSTTVVLSHTAPRSQSNARFLLSRGGDSTAAIHAAIAAAHAAGGGVVYLPGPGYLVTGLTVKNRVSLIGAGKRATCVHLAANSNVPVITNDQTLNNSAKTIRIADMWIDGNRYRQSDITTTTTTAYTAGSEANITLTSAAAFSLAGEILIGTNRLSYQGKSGNTLTAVTGGNEGTIDQNFSIGATVTQHNAHGIYFCNNPFNSGGSDEDGFDCHHLVQNVHIKNCKGEGIAIWGMSENRIDNVWVSYIDHAGFRPGFDTWMSNCTAEATGRMGYFLRYSSIRLSNCKAFLCGGNTAAEGWGFLIEGPLVLEEGDRVLASCEAQDCKADGFYFRTAQRVLAQIASSSNGVGSAAGTYVGVRIDGCTNGIIHAVCTDRMASTTQTNAIQVSSTDIATSGMEIHVTHGASAGATASSAIKLPSILTNANWITVNGATVCGGNPRNNSTATQGAGFATDTYLTGSAVPIPTYLLPVVGMRYRLRFDVTKTAAGTAAPVLTVRFGAAGTTSDTARLTFTFAAGTAAVDTAIVEVEAVFRTVGSGTSAVLAGTASLVSNLTTTGLSPSVKALAVVSSGFDSTVANSIIGASWNGGTSAAHTVNLVTAELVAA